MHIEIVDIHHLTASELAILVVIRFILILSVLLYGMTVVISAACIVLNLNHDMSHLREACL